MESVPITKQELHKCILYINDNVNELKISCRKIVLQMIMGSDIEDEKIVEKGNGTQIKFSDIEASLLRSIYNYIYNNLENPSNVI